MSGARRRRREEPEARKAQILKAARRTFLTHGFQATTVDKIASDAGVSVGLLYRFFASKSAIIRAMITEDVKSQLDEVAAVLNKASSQPDALPHLVSEQVINSPLELERFALQFEIAAEVCRKEDLRAFVRVKYLELKQALSEAIEVADGQKSAHALADKLNMASAVATGIAMHTILYSDSTELPADLVESLMSTVFAMPHQDS
jgi:AcrR family transcriptional regulator